MNWSKSMRQFHRWLSIAFTLFVLPSLATSRRGARAAQLGE
jgi:hypothetical protein